jgi:hypothetical protein
MEVRGEVAMDKGRCGKGGGCCGIDGEMCILGWITRNCWGGSVHSDRQKRVCWRDMR